jgi:hypothetical protein
MRCSYHPEIEAIGACLNCGRLVCAECQVLLKDKSYCKVCAASQAMEKQNLYSSNGLKPHNRNWFEKHLNWVAVFSYIGLYPLGYAIGWLIVSIYPYMSTELYYAIVYIIAAIWLFCICGWVLRKKRRSLWNLLWLIIPFGWIVFLCLSNKADIPKESIVYDK